MGRYLGSFFDNAVQEGENVLINFVSVDFVQNFVPGTGIQLQRDIFSVFPVDFQGGFRAFAETAGRVVLSAEHARAPVAGLLLPLK